MEKKQDQPIFTLWSAIIGVVGIILGAAIGYFGTQASAQAQIETAKINIYGPIYTTQTAEAKITPVFTPAALNVSDTLAIEQISQDIFAYAGNNNPDGWSGTFVLINDREKVPNYKLDYSLLDDKYGFAGLAFNFHESMNLSAYSAIEFVIIFSQALDEIDLYFKDDGKNFNTLRVVSGGTNEMTLRYEFKNFPDINFNAVKEIGLVASTVFSTGTHQIVVKNIRFAK